MNPVLAQLYMESRQHDVEIATRRAGLLNETRRHHRPSLRLGIRSMRRS